MRIFCRTILAVALTFASDVVRAASPFPAARGVLERFAGANVADKFVLERMAAKLKS